MKCEQRDCGSNVNGWCQFEAEGDKRPSSCTLNALVGNCAVCGKAIREGDKFCLSCCDKQTPEGPALERLRRYGFAIPYSQRQEMNLARDISGAIPTAVDADSHCIKMSHLYVACDGKTYIGHEWITPNGSSYSWDKPYVPNAPGEGRGIPRTLDPIVGSSEVPK